MFDVFSIPDFFLIGNYSMICGELNGKETQKRRDVCTHTADSL